MLVILLCCSIEEIGVTKHPFGIFWLYFEGLRVSAQCTFGEFGLIPALFPRFHWRNSLRIYFSSREGFLEKIKQNLSIFPSSRTRKAWQKTVDSTISQLFTDKFILPCSRYDVKRPLRTQTLFSRPWLSKQDTSSRQDTSGNTYLL